jgi:hypothetical protein
MKIAYDLTDEEINKAFGNANFGGLTPIEVVCQGLLKCASGYYQGYTSNKILLELKLVNERYKLTERGRKNLWLFFSDD